jgi:ubiquinone/menaquinone biosynthesis C-methylase UbiE
MAPDTYSHGHHDSVLRSHRWRTAENSAGYLLPLLRPGQTMLDIGCGPGTITLDLARRIAPGRVLGIDVAAAALEEAEAGRAGSGVDNVMFSVGDVYALDMPDGSFDIVHAHQVLQHLSDPVAALREMRRGVAPDGVVAVRDSDYGAFTWAPADPRLDRWLELYHRLTERNQAEADAGRFLPRWVRDAGFGSVEVSSSNWTFADSESRAWWSSLWAERVLRSSFAEQTVAYGLCDPAELTDLATGWREWALHDDAIFVVPSVEILARP